MSTSFNEKSNSQVKDTPKKANFTSSFGRETVFGGELSKNSFLSPNPHQKKRDLKKIQNVFGSSLQVLESNPQKEVFKEKPLTPIIRNTYQTKNGNTIVKQRCMSPVLNFSIESASFQEASSENQGFRKTFKDKCGFESNLKEEKIENYSIEKAKRGEKINNSKGMKDILKSDSDNKADGRENGLVYKELVKVTRENTINNLNSPYKFKHSYNKKQLFYLN